MHLGTNLQYIVFRIMQVEHETDECFVSRCLRHEYLRGGVVNESIVFLRYPLFISEQRIWTTVDNIL